jgi:hypothetical protein
VMASGAISLASRRASSPRSVATTRKPSRPRSAASARGPPRRRHHQHRAPARVAGRLALADRLRRRRPTSAGKRRTKVLPWPCALATVMSPPIMRARRRESARPSPVPPKRRDTLASAWPKLSKSRASCSGVMPIPVSVTAKVSQSPPGPAARSTRGSPLPPG